MSNTISLTKNTDGSVSFLCSGEEEIVIASPIQLFVDSNSISFRVESEVRAMKLSDSITIAGVLFSGTLAQLKTAVENILPGSAPSSALPTETVATYSAMTTSISSDPTTKRDFFVSADETNGGVVTSYRYNGSVLVKVGGSRIKDAMVTVLCGNSIAAGNKSSSTGLYEFKDLLTGGLLSGGAMRSKRMTASTRTDIYGIYGYSGATLPTIISDLDTQWFTPLYSAGIIPDLVIGHSLIENDISTGRTVAQIKASLSSWIRNVQNRWPGVIILLRTPLPSLNYASYVSNYQAIRDYILSLDNGSNIFVCRGDIYESPSAAAMPTYISFTGSISGSTLTVTSITGVIRQGMQIISPTQTVYGSVSYFGTGTGGVGTYILTASNTVAQTTLYAMPYTLDGIHPNNRGGVLLGRELANTLKRIASVWKHAYSALSTNMALDGSVAITGTGFSGTGATSSASSGSLTEATVVCLAEQPGMKVTIAANAKTGSATTVDTGTINLGSLSVSSVTQVSPFAVIEILSGAENIKSIYIRPRITDGGGSLFQDYIQSTSADTEPDFQNGDVLTFRCPPRIAGSGSISAVQIFIATVPKLSGGTFSYRILSQGVGIVS